MESVSGIASGPVVTVIVPVWNVEPWLRECLDSVAVQTIGTDKLRLVAVDDGSTDQSGAMLDAYAAERPWVTVIHQPNSGGPGGPRNTGLDAATGEYVFFLDADDYLGAEALERMVAMADRVGSDIVLGRAVGVGGRAIRRDNWLFSRNVDHADAGLASRSGNVQKLFRRSLLARAALRFGVGVPGGEDVDFMARAYLAARGISILADYACYFLRRREGSQTTRRDRSDDLGEALERLESERLVPIGAGRRPRLERELLVYGQLGRLSRKFRGRWLQLEADERERVFLIGARIARRWSTPRVERALPGRAALVIYCLVHGLQAELEEIAACPPRVAYGRPLVEGRRVYARFPHFRSAAGIPDRCFDITRSMIVEQTLRRATLEQGRLVIEGEALLRLVGGTTEIELRRRPHGPAVRVVPTRRSTPELRDGETSYPDAGFAASIDLSTVAGGRPLPRGSWAVRLSVGTDEIRRVAPLTIPRLMPVREVIAVPADEGARLQVAPGRVVRLIVGRLTPAQAVLELACDAATRLRRGLTAAVVGTLRRTAQGQRLVQIMVGLRPGIGDHLDL